MEEKKTIKISLSTFFLILAIIVICVMGFFLYNLNSKNVAMVSYQTELNSKIADLEDEIKSKAEKTEINANKNVGNSNLNETSNSNDAESNSSNIENNITFSSLRGKYIGNAEVEPGTTPDGETEVRLYLYENGSYRYENMPGLGSCDVGYYTFSGDNLILHQIVACGNDIGRGVVSETVTLKINNDNTIKDSELKVTLKKSSDKIEEYDVISTELKNGLNNNSLR